MMDMKCKVSGQSSAQKIGSDHGGPSAAELRRSYHALVRAVLGAAAVLAPEAFAERTPAEYASDPEAIRRLADLVESLAAIHGVAARHGSAVLSATWD